jgi:hypothetical protein
MNVMFADRQFVLIPYVKGLSLIDRILLGNQHRRNPKDLAALKIDPKVMGRHRDVADVPGDYVKKAYAFYWPTNDCPMTYRELALWFMLWSIQPAKAKENPDHPHTFWNAYAGLEDLIGVGLREMPGIADGLQHHGLIEHENASWYLEDYQPYAGWFLAKEETGKIPAKFLEREKQRMAAKAIPEPITPTPAKPLAEMDDDELEVVFTENFAWPSSWNYDAWTAEKRAFYDGWYNRRKAKEKGLAPKPKSDMLNKNTTEVQNDNPTIPEPTDNEEQPDFLQRLRSM